MLSYWKRFPRSLRTGGRTASGRCQLGLIILTTLHGDVEIHRVLKSGARAYILKSMPPTEVVNAIRHVYA
jgi:DNA-binding NarL/FixJ family response regulator